MIPDSLASELSDMSKISSGNLPQGDYSLAELKTDTDRLKAHSLNMTRFSNNRLDGVITTQIKQLVLFSFPFDSGWQAVVNGKETPVLMVDGGLSAVLSGPGENEISLRYSPPFVKAGIMLSLLGLIIFGLLATKRFRRTAA